MRINLRHGIRTFGLMFFSLITHAQIELDRQVIGTVGGTETLSGNVIWEYTGGEPIIETLTSEETTITQGFHQPSSGASLQFEVITEQASCPTSTDGVARLVNITGCSPPYEISWSNGVSGPDSLDRLLPGTYFVTVTSPFCESTAEFTIGVDPEGNCVLRFFNAFTPNGDGKSETWTIENITRPEFSDNTVEIFNRWGQSVYAASNYDNTDVVWRGEGESGAMLPSGTYFYVVEVNEQKFKGYIELIR